MNCFRKLQINFAGITEFHNKNCPRRNIPFPSRAYIFYAQTFPSFSLYFYLLFIFTLLPKAEKPETAKPFSCKAENSRSPSQSSAEKPSRNASQPRYALASASLPSACSPSSAAMRKKNPSAAKISGRRLLSRRRTGRLPAKSSQMHPRFRICS